jgi:hypothetical protein
MALASSCIPMYDGPYSGHRNRQEWNENDPSQAQAKTLEGTTMHSPTQQKVGRHEHPRPMMQLEERPILGTEEVDGESYTIQHREFALFAMRPGVARVPPTTIRFESPWHSPRSRSSIT